MGNGFTQTQNMRQGFAFQARLAGLLEMPEKEYSQLIKEIESDSLFLKLRYSQEKSDRAIHSRKLHQADLSQRFFELKENIAQEYVSGAEVEKILADKENLMCMIRKIGEEKFKKYFIYNEDEFSLSEIEKYCDLSEGETQAILSLVNDVDIHSEFFIRGRNIPENSLSFNKIAILTKTPNAISVQFSSAHWARGLYEVDYEKIKRMVAAGKISKDDNKKLKKLFDKMEFVNLRKSLMHNIVLRIIEKQNGYLKSSGKAELVPFLQAELAKEINVHPSIISRAISSRSIETPWGEEKPLKEFFVSGKIKHKNIIFEYIKKIIKEEKENNQNNRFNKPLTDNEVANILKEKYSLIISKRTVAKYRNKLQISSSFKRKNS